MVSHGVMDKSVVHFVRLSLHFGGPGFDTQGRFFSCKTNSLKNYFSYHTGIVFLLHRKGGRVYLCTSKVELSVVEV